MRTIVILIFLSFFAGVAQAKDLCKKGDLKDCTAFLKKLNESEKGERFEKAYNEICEENPKFKCVRKVVRGDVKEEMKYSVEEQPKAVFFEVTLDEETSIFSLEGKPESKSESKPEVKPASKPAKPETRTEGK